MALKIERIWSGSYLAPKIEGASEKKRDDQGQKQDQKKEDEREDQSPIDRQSLETAVEEFKKSEAIAGTGMQVEAVETKDGLQVHLKQASGLHVKTMSAQDFMKLRESSGIDQASRGKILDQKF